MPNGYIEGTKNGSAPFDNEFLDKTGLVNQIECSFRANVLSNPESILKKQHLFKGENLVIVGVDVIRCATTSCAVLAAGGSALRFYGKRSDLIEKLYLDLGVFRNKGLSCVTMGEFAGKPMPGGISANSPQAITPELVRNNRVLFLTKNLGDLCCDVIKIIEDDLSQWKGEFLIGCLHNLTKVCEHISRLGKPRIVFCCGGFRKTESLEDLYFVGKVLKELGIPETECDDAALTAIAVYEKYQNQQNLLAALQTSRVFQVLKTFGMDKDISSSILGEFIDPYVLKNMVEILPRLVFEDSFAWFIQ